MQIFWQYRHEKQLSIHRLHDFKNQTSLKLGRNYSNRTGLLANSRLDRSKVS